MSRDATGLWSRLATARMVCAACGAVPGQACRIGQGTLGSRHGSVVIDQPSENLTHITRTELYLDAHNAVIRERLMELETNELFITVLLSALGAERENAVDTINRLRELEANSTRGGS